MGKRKKIYNIEDSPKICAAWTPHVHKDSPKICAASFENALFSHVHSKTKIIHNIEDNTKICAAGEMFLF
jgi:hypothetical protein